MRHIYVIIKKLKGNHKDTIIIGAYEDLNDAIKGVAQYMNDQGCGLSYQFEGNLSWYSKHSTIAIVTQEVY